MPTLLDVGIFYLATRQIDLRQMRKEDKAKYNYKRIEVYLTPKDAALFEKKAVHYKNWGPFIRDAVKQFNDLATKGKLEALCEMVNLYKKHQQELSWLGGNLNQAMKRANEMAQSKELSQSYYDEVLFPLVREIQEFLHDIKEEQHQIARILTRKL